MTRWHENDIAAKLLEQGWEEFRLPALAETDDLLGREPGQPLLTPQAEETEGEAIDRWARTREEVGSMVWAGLYQQRPAPAEGSMFNADDLQDAPDNLDLTEGTWITSWDLSFGGSGDYTVGTVWQGLNNGTYVLHDIIRGRWEFTQQLAAFKRTAQRYPQCSHHLVEAAANGAAMVDTTRRTIPGVTPIKPLGGKVERWQAITPLMEAHKVATVGGAWLTALRDEMVVAPNGAHDDQLDSFAQALNWYRVRHLGPPKVATSTVSRRLPGR
jgi:predicted phage terminase large subunit-like protein